MNDSIKEKIAEAAQKMTFPGVFTQGAEFGVSLMESEVKTIVRIYKENLEEILSSRYVSLEPDPDDYTDREKLVWLIDQVQKLLDFNPEGFDSVNTQSYEILELESEVSELKAEVEKLKAPHYQMSFKRVDELKAKVQSQSEEIASLKAENEKLRHALEMTKTNLQDDIEVINEQLDNINPKSL